MKLIHLIAISLTACQLVGAGEVALEQVLAGKEVALTLRFKDLDSNWRRFSASGGADPTNIYRAMYGAVAPGAYYTKGQTLLISGETYLVAYKPQMKPLDLAALNAAMRAGQPPEVEKPTATTRLALALLHLRSTGSLTDIRPVDLDEELGGDSAAGAEGGDAGGEGALKHLRQLGVALMSYVSERRVLPVLTDAKAAKEELLLYVRNKEAFSAPGSTNPFLPNPALSGAKPTDFENPDKVVVFYESAPGNDGTRACLFLDGHAERVTEQQFKKFKDSSKLP